jgi:dihydroorotase
VIQLTKGRNKCLIPAQLPATKKLKKYCFFAIILNPLSSLLMKLLLQKAIISAPDSPLFGQQADLLIVDDTIAQIAPNIAAEADQVMALEGLHVSAGWLDIFAHACDPGFEYKETLESAVKAANAGGYTQFFALPNTNPVVHNKGMVEYIQQKNNSLSCQVFPLGAITKQAEGKELAEMYDMRNSGAVAFTDGLNSLQNSGLLLKALQYVKAFGGVVIQIPDDKNIAAHGLMHESVVSTRLGLAGKPAIVEELMVARDIELVRYTESRLHFTGISSARSLELIAAAKQQGLDISCSVSPMHLNFCDEDLLQYDTNLKTNPPLRSAADKAALRNGIATGVIDCIASHHLPQDIDHKICEFEHALPGSIGLETCFAATITAGINWQQWVQMQTNARRIFNLPAASLSVGAKADLSLFLPNASNEFTTKQIKSRSQNSAFLGKTLQAKVLGVFHKGQLYLNP